MEVPERWIRREWRGNYKGQKQIWYLLRLTGRDSDVSLRRSTHPEFDAWRWNQYWVELDSVVEFKRKVYMQALTELARLLKLDCCQEKDYNDKIITNNDLIKKQTEVNDCSSEEKIIG